MLIGDVSPSNILETLLLRLTPSREWDVDIWYTHFKLFSGPRNLHFNEYVSLLVIIYSNSYLFVDFSSTQFGDE